MTPASNGTHPAAEDPRRPCRILLVDDDPDVLESIRILLSQNLREIEFVAVPGPQEALEALASGRFSGIVTDFKMPIMDGFQFLEAARRQGGILPSLMVTALPDLEVGLDQRAALGLQGILQKPFQTAEFVLAVSRLVSLGAAA